jgi:lipoyl(octanoyl) transferase
MRSASRNAVQNMAFDEAMLRTAADTGATLIRLYTWDVPSLSLGRNQKCAGIYSAERCEALAVPVVRRLTGGRALLHGREITYSVAAPTSAAPTLRGGYNAINDCLLVALQQLGVEASVAAPAARTPSPDLAPCFETPAAGELVVGSQKLVGSAQHRDAHAFLQHGSILLNDDQSLLGALAHVALPLVPPPATLRTLLGDSLSIGVVFDALRDAFRGVTTGSFIESSDEDFFPDRVAEAASRYRDPRWTWRR